MATRIFPKDARHLFSRSAHVLKDQRKREAVAADEVQRRAYLFIARNTSLPANIRHRAQLGLNALNDGAGRPTQVRSRCIFSGKGRGIMTKFGMSRYHFRQLALSGEIPGVQKASW